MSDEARSVEYGELWLEVVAAVEYLGATHRPGLTVWDVLGEAVRWWTGAWFETDNDFEFSATSDLLWNDPDALRSSLARLGEVISPLGSIDGMPLAAALDGALAAWLSEASRRFNDGHSFGRSPR